MKEIYKKEINKLDEFLHNAGIPYEVAYCHDGLQICYPEWGDARISDAVCHHCSYGGDLGLLEQMGLVENEWDDVEGFLTAEEIFQRWTEHWKQNHSVLCP